MERKVSNQLKLKIVNKLKIVMNWELSSPSKSNKIRLNFITKNK